MSRQPAEKKCSVILPDGQELHYIWVRKSVKNINIRVRPDGVLGVSSPCRVTEQAIRTLLVEKSDFICRALARYRSLCAAQDGPAGADGEQICIWGTVYTVSSRISSRGSTVLTPNGQLVLQLRNDTPEERKKQIMAFLTDESRRRFIPLYHRVLERFRTLPAFPQDINPPIRFRWMRSRWGSCRPADPAVTLNTRLLLYPESCAEYVIVHELAHLLQPNHSPAFYAVVAAILPDWQERRDLLREK